MWYLPVGETIFMTNFVFVCLDIMLVVQKNKGHGVIGLLHYQVKELLTCVTVLMKNPGAALRTRAKYYREMIHR